MKDWMLQEVADRQTGEDRRKKIPLGQRMDIPGPTLLSEGWEGRDVEVKEGLLARDNGEQQYWCTLTPVDLKRLECVVVYFHGYSSSSSFLEFNAMATMAHMGNCGMIGVDMPGHGRSDGNHLYVEGWHPFVDCAAAFVEKFCTEKVAEWSKLCGKQLKLFALGESMGGGIVTTLSLKKPDTFSGIILYSPMIAVSPEAFPPAPVVWLFKNVLVPLLPDWPIAPNKDLVPMNNSDPDVCALWRGNPLGAGHMKPKLMTAQSFAFEAPEWMEPRLPDVSTPFLIIHAAGDRITDPEMSKKLHSVAKAEDKTIKLYEDAEHMDPLHGGPTKKELIEKVFGDVIAWLRERAK